MKNLLSRSCAVLLVLVVLVGIPMVAFAELDAGGASGISGVASLTRTELEAMENEFFGPEGIEVLEIQLASLQGQWAVVNEQLLSIDADLVAAREAGHESGRRVRNEEDRVQRGRAASESQGFGIYAQAGSTESLGGELEAELGRARSMQRRLQAQEQAREEVLETLLAIEASIDGVHDAINQAWYNFDLAHSHMEEAEYNDEPDDVYYAGDERESCEHEYDECFCDYLDFEPCEVDCSCPFYFYNGQWRPVDFSSYVDEFGNFWYGVGNEWFESMDVEFEPFAQADGATPVRMSDAEIGAYASRTADEQILITNSAQLVQFINRVAPFDNDSGHFMLQPASAGYIFTLNTNVAQGRAGIFTGIFDGNGNTIRGYRFRPAGTNANHTSIGFIQQAGHGAVIRNVNFDSGIAFVSGTTNLPMASGTAAARTAATAANNDSVWYDSRYNTGATWRNTQTSIGMVLGRATGYGAPAGGAVVSIDNVRLVGHHEMRQWAGSHAQSTKNLAGMVGSVEANTTLNMRDVNIADSGAFAANVTILVARWDGAATRPTVRTGAGLVAALHGGNLNVVTSNPEVRNIVNVDMRAGDRSTTATPTLDTGIGFGGAVTGFVYGGNVTVENTTTRSTRRAADPIRVLHVGGGVIGGTTDPRSVIVLSNVINSAGVHVNARGGATTIFGGAGGLVGRTAGLLHITNSSNTAQIRHQNVDAIAGGIVGDVGPAAVAIIADSTNTGIVSNWHEGSGDTATNQPGNAQIGGIIGQSRGVLDLTNVTNSGWVNKAATDSRGNANTSIGGIIGRLFPAIGRPTVLTNVTNQANVRSGTTGHGSVGGIIGEIMPWQGGGVGIINLIDVRNIPGPATGQGAQGVTGGRDSGGIVGFNRAAGVRLEQMVAAYPFNSAPVSATQRHSSAGGVVGLNAGARLSITGAGSAAGSTATNTGNVSANHRDGNAGGIIGRILRSGNDVQVTAVRNTGNVSATKGVTAGTVNAGGIVGNALAARLVIDGARNNGNVATTQRNSRVGGILGDSSGGNITLNNVYNTGLITANAAWVSHAGGIVGRSNAINLHIRNAVNRGAVGGPGNNSTLPRRAGGILGQSGRAGLRINNVVNHGNVSATNSGNNFTAAGGVIGRMLSGARDNRIDGAMNHGNIHVGGTVAANRNPGGHPAGGIVGCQRGVNFVVRNSGNAGNVHALVTGAAAHRVSAGSGGIIGRSRGANTRIENAFNNGYIRGGRATGGLMGRVQGTATLFNVYNIGTVFGETATAWSGNGLVGRRSDTARFNVTNAYVSGRVGGVAVVSGRRTSRHTGVNSAPPAQGTARPAGAVSYARANAHFSNVFVDETAFVSTSAGTSVVQRTNAMAQCNRNARNRSFVHPVTTEFLTAGFIPGLSGGVWRTGVMDRETGALISLDYVRTYPYFYWQLPNYRRGMLQEEFFGLIRILDDHPDAAVRAGYHAVMDVPRHTSAGTVIRYHFTDWQWDTDGYLTGGPVPGATSLFQAGTRMFIPYVNAGASHFANVPAPGSDGRSAAPAFAFTNPDAPTGVAPRRMSAGLISPNGIVGFETGEIPNRVVIRAQDPLFYPSYDHWINHAVFEIISGCVIEQSRINNGIGMIPGLLAINFEVEEDGTITGIDPTRLEVRVTALGYRTETHRIEVQEPGIRYQHIQGPLVSSELEPRQHPIHIAMSRIPFPVRVWVLEAPADRGDNEGAADEDDFPPPANPVANSRMHHGRGDVNTQVLANLSGSCMVPGTDCCPMVCCPERNAPDYFIAWIMWGDDVAGTAPFFTTDIRENLRYEHLFIPDPELGERTPFGMLPDHDGTMVAVRDLHLYIEDHSLPSMQIHAFRDIGQPEGHFQFGNFTGSMNTADHLYDAWHWFFAENEFEIEFDNNRYNLFTCCDDGIYADLSPRLTARDTSAANNWRLSPNMGIGMHPVENPAAAHLTPWSAARPVMTSAQVITHGVEDTRYTVRNNTIIMPENSSGTGPRNALRDVYLQGFTLLQGSNPYFWAGAETGNYRLHLDTVFRVTHTSGGYDEYGIWQEGYYYRTDWLRMADFVQEMDISNEDSDTEDIRTIQRIDVPLIPTNPHTQVGLYVHVYAPVPNADGTGYLYIGGTRQYELVPSAEIATDAYDLQPILVFDENDPECPGAFTGRFTVTLGDEGNFYYFDVTAENGMYGQREVNILENYAGDLIWTGGQTIEIRLTRPRHTVRFEAGHGGTLSYGSNIGSQYRELELIQGTLVSEAAHVPNPVNDESFLFIDWVREVEYEDDIPYAPNPSGHIVQSSVTFRARFGPVLTIENLPQFDEPYPYGQTVSGLGREVGGQVTLVEGATPSNENWQFLGWVRGDVLPSDGMDINEFTGAPVHGSGHYFTMPDQPITYTAIWGFGGVVGRPGVMLTIGNAPEMAVTPAGQTASGNRPRNTPVTLAHGTLYEGYDFEFFGWIRGSTLPSVGVNIDEWLALPENSEVTLRTESWSFNMPDTAIAYTAIWGNHGIVGGDPHRVTFHFYGTSEEPVIIPVEIGQPINPLALATIVNKVESEDVNGWAVWGWFTDEALNSSGRTRGNLRRPTVGTEGFDLSAVITQELFSSLAVNGNIDLYAIWVLWGDLDDSDDVHLLDLDILRSYLRFAPNVQMVRQAAYVTRRAEISLLDLDMIRDYLRFAPNVQLGRPRP